MIMLQFVTLFYFQEIFIRKIEYIFVMKEKNQNLQLNIIYILQFNFDI